MSKETNIQSIQSEFEQIKKAAVKREQSHTCLSYAEQEQARLEGKTAEDGKEYWSVSKLAQIDAMMDINNIGNSYESVQFRIWARNILKEFIIKGFVMDDERLKGNIPFGTDYFNDLIERALEIRRSERNNCQKITDIFAEFSCDYDPKCDITKAFYKTMRNLMRKDNDLNLLTESFIVVAERNAKQHLITTMADWNQMLINKTV